MKNAEDKLREMGYKITGPRQKVLAYLQKQKKPRSAKEIYGSLANVNVDRTTVYRTLQLFTDLGLVFEERFTDESMFYTAKKPHHHAICIKCHYVECIPCHNEITKPKDFASIDHNIMVSGVCKKCT
ncbi:transcriptional repressor [Patescibacteria group bacterium]|nr:transcriptional repressor [Patescibacteria group bacterium]